MDYLILALDYLGQGTPPGEVVASLEDSLKLVDLDQQMLERYLARGGEAYLEGERKAVDEHIQQAAGDKPFQDLIP